MDSSLLVDNLYVIATILAGMGLLLFSRLKFIPKLIRGFIGILLIVVAFLAGGLGYELNGFGHIDDALILGRVEFAQIDDQHYVALVHLEHDTYHYELKGDEWQIDARVLSWKGMFNPSASYKFTRISGRYSDIGQEKNSERSVYQVRQSESYVDVWQLVRSTPVLQEWVSADQGNSVFMPMSDQALYSISLGEHGLIARAENDQAKQALLNWQ